jgi:hypothetical protein
MVKHVIIENGVVINVVVSEADFAAEQGWIASDEAQIGDTWDGTTFTSPPAPEPAPLPPPPSKEQLLAQLQALQAQIQAIEETPS